MRPFLGHLELYWRLWSDFDFSAIFSSLMKFKRGKFAISAIFLKILKNPKNKAARVQSIFFLGQKSHFSKVPKNHRKIIFFTENLYTPVLDHEESECSLRLKCQKISNFFFTSDPFFHNFSEFSKIMAEIANFPL